MKRIIFATIASCLALAMASCYNEGTLVTNPAPLTEYQFKPTQAKLLNVAKTYAESINDNLAHNTLHPGLYADYGVALAQLGCLEQAHTMFNNEKAFFPNSTAYVDMLIQTLTPQLAADKHIDTSKIDLKTLDTIRITLTPEEEALQQQLFDDPEYQRMLKQQQKEEKELKAQEARKAKEARAKAREAERKAAAKEKEKQQKAKAAAKKQAEKEKKQAAKEAQKAKKEAEKAKQKEAKAAKQNK